MYTLGKYMYRAYHFPVDPCPPCTTLHCGSLTPAAASQAPWTLHASAGHWVRHEGRVYLHTLPMSALGGILAVAASPPYSQRLPTRFQDPLVAFPAGHWGNHLSPTLFSFGSRGGGGLLLY